MESEVPSRKAVPVNPADILPPTFWQEYSELQNEFQKMWPFEDAVSYVNSTYSNGDGSVGGNIDIYTEYGDLLGNVDWWQSTDQAYFNFHNYTEYLGGVGQRGCKITKNGPNGEYGEERLESSCLTQYYRDAFMRLQSCSDDEEAIAGLSHMGTIRDGGLVVISMVNDITPERVTLYYGDGAPHEIPVMTDMTVIENVNSTENEYKLRVAFEKNGIFYDQFASEVSNIAIDVNSTDVNSTGRTYIIEYDEVKSCVKDDSCLCPSWEINGYTISEVNRINITSGNKTYTLSDSDVDCDCLKACNCSSTIFI